MNVSEKTHSFRGGMKANQKINYAYDMKIGVPTDSGELTPVDTVTSTLSLLEKEGIKQVKWLKQEAHVI